MPFDPLLGPDPFPEDNVVRLKPRPNPFADEEILDLSTARLGSEPPVEWLVDGLIPVGSVCLFSGNKSLGKSSLLMDLLISSALGRPWLGRETTKLRGFGMFCEDPARVLLWRRDRILERLQADPADIESDVHVRSGHGKFSFLRRYRAIGEERGQETPLWHDWLAPKLDLFGAQLLVLDTRSDVLQGSANNPFIAIDFLVWLTGWAAQREGAVILTVHPPKDQSETWAGCNEWSSKPRAHLHLTRPAHYDPLSYESRGERMLTRIKGNLGEDAPLELPLRWDSESQTFIGNNAEVEPPRHDFFGQLEFELQVLAAVKSLILDGAAIHASPTKRWSLPRAVKALPGFQRYPDSALVKVQDRLVGDGRLVRVTIGVNVLLRPPEMTYPGE
jgi:hypothetical protein